MDNKKTVSNNTKRSETQQRLQAALANKPSRSGLPVYELNKIITPLTPVGRPTYQVRNGLQKRTTRPNQALSPFAAQQITATQRLNLAAADNLQITLRNWLGDEGDWYLGFGGVGDALLLLAACYDNPNAKVAFFHNEQHFTKQWFDLFNLNVFLHTNIMGQRWANHIYDMMINSPHFKTSAHLADGLNYGDWTINPFKYKERMITKVPWIEHFGKACFDKPTVVISPCGSHRDISRQRYLTLNEYNQLIKLYLDKEYIVLIVGSSQDYKNYNLPNNPNCRWLMSDGIIDHTGKKQAHTLKDMLTLINGAEEVISMDTWLKTYALLCGLPIKVFMTRWHGAYHMVGTDCSDGIFMNKDIWPTLEILRIEDLLPNNCSIHPLTPVVAEANKP